MYKGGQRATTWGAGSRNICEGVEYAREGGNVEYITHDGVGDFNLEKEGDDKVDR